MREPLRHEFKPDAVGTKLPHQVVWANAGIDLLNASKTDIELYQYDTATGELVERCASVAPSRDVDRVTRMPAVSRRADRLRSVP